MAGSVSIENGKKGGRPQGVKNKKTLERELQLERLRQRVFKAQDVIIDGQLANARGISYLYRIDKDEKGKNKRPELVTSQYEIERYLSGEYDHDPDRYYYITTEKPETAAAAQLWDRAFGKASQPITDPNDGPIQLSCVEIIIRK